ncbi:Nucleolar protein 16 [Auxenochlorella protothecoides]|uniref:Nucleolar protein 16 n=1 Tax=Auxenochlorella protothecoides TaxID=3075 RepID=A0A087SC31_AUXPR|nr:Nucleolar protein 16 [Auxenochlorella protothecoides]KFM23285.1 Nucleolar protein 16 [Auxenochlorella protothecoides]
MGRSLRRHKASRPKIIKRKKKSVNKKLDTRSKEPEELTALRPDMEAKLGAQPEWAHESTVVANYGRLGFVGNPNRLFGRNAVPVCAPEPSSHAPGSDAEEAVDDDDLRAVLGKVRSTGPAAPKRLTKHQRDIVARLVAAHGDDTRAMMMDLKLNPMQHSEGVLQKLIASYKHWGPGAGVEFRVPVKSLW